MTLCCFIKGLGHVYKQLCIKPGHQQGPRGPVLACTHARTRRSLLCTPWARGSPMGWVGSVGPDGGRATPTSTCSSALRPAARLSSPVPASCSRQRFLAEPCGRPPGLRTGSAAGMQHLGFLIPPAAGTLLPASTREGKSQGKPSRGRAAQGLCQTLSRGTASMQGQATAAVKPPVSCRVCPHCCWLCG